MSENSPLLGCQSPVVLLRYQSTDIDQTMLEQPRVHSDSVGSFATLPRKPRHGQKAADQVLNRASILADGHGNMMIPAPLIQQFAQSQLDLTGHQGYGGRRSSHTPSLEDREVRRGRYIHGAGPPAHIRTEPALMEQEEPLLVESNVDGEKLVASGQQNLDALEKGQVGVMEGTMKAGARFLQQGGTVVVQYSLKPFKRALSWGGIGAMVGGGIGVAYMGTVAYLNYCYGDDENAALATSHFMQALAPVTGFLTGGYAVGRTAYWLCGSKRA